MSVSEPSPAAGDALWQAILSEAARDASAEPILASFLHATILKHATFEDALSFHLAGKLERPSLPGMLIREVIEEAMGADPSIAQAARADIRAVHTRDPACRSFSEPLLYFKGFHALQSYRVAHWLWIRGRRPLALWLQNRISPSVFQTARIPLPPVHSSLTRFAWTISVMRRRTTWSSATRCQPA